jgi:hypothetical protein
VGDGKVRLQSKAKAWSFINAINNTGQVNVGYFEHNLSKFPVNQRIWKLVKPWQ